MFANGRRAAVIVNVTLGDVVLFAGVATEEVRVRFMICGMRPSCVMSVATWSWAA